MTELFAFLKSKGIDVYLNSRNSIYKNDKKIGGNAQFTNRKNIISHCTLLFSSDLVQLNRSIESPFKLIESKASKSVRSDVVNLSEFISEDTAESLHSDLMEYYRLQPNKKVINLDRNQQNQIENDYVAKMKSFDWVYGRSPKCELYVNHEQFSIQHGKISTCTVEGLVQLPFLPSAELIRYF